MTNWRNSLQNEGIANLIKLKHRASVCLCNLTIVRAEVPGFVVQSQRSLGVASLLAEPVTEKEREKKGFVLIRGDLNRASERGGGLRRTT